MSDLLRIYTSETGKGRKVKENKRKQIVRSSFAPDVFDFAVEYSRICSHVIYLNVLESKMKVDDVVTVGVCLRDLRVCGDDVCVLCFCQNNIED